AGRRAVLRVVVLRVVLVRPDVDHLVPAGRRQVRGEMVLEFVARVVGTEVDAHRLILRAQLGEDQSGTRLRGEPGALAGQLLPGQVHRDEVVDRDRRDQYRQLRPAGVDLAGEPRDGGVAADV